MIVLGKGRRPRACPFGHKTAIALDRYIRARQAQKIPYLDALWLGQREPVTDSGISQIVEKRGLKAGIEGLYPHQLRHTFASGWLSDGGNEIDLMAPCRVSLTRDAAALRRIGRRRASRRGAQATRARGSLLRPSHPRGTRHGDDRG